MTQFIAALVLFLALHMVPAIPALRAALVAAMGRRAYLIVYSLASILALAWLFHAALRLDFIPLWDPEPWHAWIPIVLTPLGLFFLVAGLSSPNPASITFRKPGAVPGAITAITRHPVLWGFALWAGSHLVANGDLRSVLLFGILFAYSILGMFMIDRRARRRLGDQWPPLAKSTSAWPFRAVLAGKTRLRVDVPMIMAISTSALLTAWLLLGGHAMLFGADPLSMVAG
ncbi:NnrU family protein [Devosia psychrophila]|uniref:NnrU family protein n=1 Tax=Devosia psychrophila TaxID=728005 RepID=A0A0F5PRU8_9HYPH|nr:NnrU family protein [Devosia psychrophila]KKC31330.1 NnrU family protein [Devosia psychrophila]SFC89883.1 Uncharacterized membrane protein [Devosia psychrophila]